MASSSQDLDSAESVADRTQPNWALRKSKAWTVVAILLLVAAAGRSGVHSPGADPVHLGGFIAFHVRPIVTKFERRMSRGSAVATTFILILVVSVLLAVLLVPRLVENLQSFAADLPGKVQQAQENAAVVSDKLSLPPAVKSAITTAADGMASEFRAAMQSIVQFMLAAGGAAVGLGFDIFLGFIIAIWLMLGGSSLSKWSLSVMPPAWRDGAWEIGTSFDRSFGGFIRGLGHRHERPVRRLRHRLLRYRSSLQHVLGVDRRPSGRHPVRRLDPGRTDCHSGRVPVSPTVGVLTIIVVLIMEHPSTRSSSLSSWASP